MCALPHATSIGVDNGLPCFGNQESFAKFFEIAHRSINPKLRWRMRVGLNLQPQCFGRGVRAPNLPESKEEPLLRCETVNGLLRIR